MKTNQSNFAGERISGRAEFAIQNLVVSSFAETSPFAVNGYEPDRFTAYVEFDICHSLPGAWLGPLFNTGEYMGFMPATLSLSHKSLRHKQFNFRHRLKANGSKGPDHIIGATLDTWIPEMPPEGWWSPSNPAGAQSYIKVCAAVFKQANDVAGILERHNNGEEVQSVSVEVSDFASNLRLYRPSTGEIVGYDEIPQEWADAFEFPKGGKRPLAKKQLPNGERIIVIYGGAGNKVQFSGVGMTPNPAERHAGTDKPIAEITSVLAEGDELCAVAAEAVPRLIEGKRVKFDTGALGTICSVETSGHHCAHIASKDEPVCVIMLRGKLVSMPLSKALKKIM
jgi:hypothetical protein